MVVSTLPIRRLTLLGVVAAVTATLAPAGAAAAETGPDSTNGVVPLNPYVVNCGLPARGNHAIGGAPDAGAIIACRHSPICLSYYVNYPGTLIVPGYRP